MSIPSREACASCAVKRSSPMRSRRSRGERKRTRSSAPRAAPSSASGAPARTRVSSGAPRRASRASSASGIGGDDPVRRLQQRCHSTLTASSSRACPQRSSASSQTGPSAATGLHAGSKPSARAPIFAASRAAPSASSAARWRKSSSEDRVGSTQARMTSARASKRHGCMFPPEGAELAHATTKRTSSGVGAPAPGGGIRDRDGLDRRRRLRRGRRRQRRLAPVGRQRVEIGVEAPRRGELAQRDAPHRVGHHRAAQGDVGSELRPGRDALLDLDHRRRRPVREARRVEDADHVRDLLLGGQAAERGRGDVAQEPVEGRPIGLEVEALDVEHPAMARGHDHGAPRGARVLAQAHLHLQVVALVDDHVGARHEVGDGRLLHSPGIGHDADVRVELGHLAGSQDDLAHADVGEAAGHPIEVRQVEDVEVGEPQLAADALVRHRGHHRAPDRQAGDGHAEPRQALLLLRRDGVAVAVQAQLAVQGLGQDVHQPAAPRIEGPRAEALRLAALEHALRPRRAARRRASCSPGTRPLHELLDLLGERVDDDHGRIRDQLERARTRSRGPPRRAASARRS